MQSLLKCEECIKGKLRCDAFFGTRPPHATTRRMLVTEGKCSCCLEITRNKMIANRSFWCDKCRNSREIPEHSIETIDMALKEWMSKAWRWDAMLNSGKAIKRYNKQKSKIDGKEVWINAPSGFLLPNKYFDLSECTKTPTGYELRDKLDTNT